MILRLQKEILLGPTSATTLAHFASFRAVLGDAVNVAHARLWLPSARQRRNHAAKPSSRRGAAWSRWALRRKSLHTEEAHTLQSTPHLFLSSCAAVPAQPPCFRCCLHFRPSDPQPTRSDGPTMPTLGAHVSYNYKAHLPRHHRPKAKPYPSPAAAAGAPEAVLAQGLTTGAAPHAFKPAQWATLDDIDLAEELRHPVPAIQEVPPFLRGALRGALVQALRGFQKTHSRIAVTASDKLPVPGRCSCSHRASVPTRRVDGSAAPGPGA